MLGGDSGAVEFDQPRLPFVYQFRCLMRAPLGTGKHSLHMDALQCRFVWLVGGMIGHRILMHTRRDLQQDFITDGLSSRRRVLSRNS